MPNTREKLIELLRNSLCFGYDDVTDSDYVMWNETAERLIANGVTIADDTDIERYNAFFGEE